MFSQYYLSQSISVVYHSRCLFLHHTLFIVGGQNFPPSGEQINTLVFCNAYILTLGLHDGKVVIEETYQSLIYLGSKVAYITSVQSVGHY